MVFADHIFDFFVGTYAHEVPDHHHHHLTVTSFAASSHLQSSFSHHDVHHHSHHGHAVSSAFTTEKTENEDLEPPLDWKHRKYIFKFSRMNL